MDLVYQSALAKLRAYVASFNDVLADPLAPAPVRVSMRARRDYWHGKISWILRRMDKCS